MRASGPRRLGLAALLAVAACRPAEPTSKYATAAIWVEAAALQREDASLSVHILLRDGPTDAAHHLFLDGDDALLVSLDRAPHDYLSFRGDVFGNVADLTGNVKVLAKRDLLDDHAIWLELLLGIPEYEAAFAPAPGGAPPRAYLEFDRPGQPLSGTSWADVPAGFEVTAPGEQAVLSRSGPLALAWSSPDPSATMEAEVAVDCGQAFQRSVVLALGADTGSASLARADYFPHAGAPAGATCSAALLLRRVRHGSISTAFAGGSFRGVQQRTVRFLLAP